MIPADISVVDFQGLEQLRRTAAGDGRAALEESAVQFEALVLGLMLKTARDARLGEGLFDNAATDHYFELLDQQVALELARNGGFGFRDMLVRQLSQGLPGEAARPAPPATAAFRDPLVRPLSRTLPTEAARLAAPNEVAFEATTPADFVRELLPEAQKVAAKLGVDPKLVLAQAALETGWGRSMPRHPDGRSANNLFGIKATGGWTGARVSQWTLESVAGAVERQRAQFRAYPTPAASFADYAQLIAASDRYAGARSAAADVEAYARGIAAAGYATDPAYADKWLAVYHGDEMRAAVETLKKSGIEPTP
jgi:peptidoglycan hydrolase FlgJ